MTSTTRTRFAPSPTGFLHVGGVRTALFAWLLARQNDGQFILRLEDTDKNREVEGSADHLMLCLKTLGIDYDEGPDKPGDHGPYIQSQRLDIYKEWAQKLIDSGRAYADPYSREELDDFRAQAKQAKRAFLYRHHRPANPPAWDGTTPLRFKSDPKDYSWHDEVMGDLQTGPEVIDDFILIKSDGYPTYNFAHIVDDAEMKISHVIRGQEFISSQPNYLNLYEALGVKPPVFATMPHIMAETGGKKLGKRDGAKDVLDYVRDGFLPETLVNFIASLGWNDGTEQEVFTVKELISKFRLDHVQRSGARFDNKRLEWMNGQHIRELSLDDLYQRVADFWPASADDNDVYKKNVLELMQARLKTLKDLQSAGYFFVDPEPDWSLADSSKPLRKLDNETRRNLLAEVRDALDACSLEPDSIQQCLNDLLVKTDSKPAQLFGLIRLSLTWSPFSPDLNLTIALLGKNAVMKRLQTAIDSIE
ncbi:MAG: glutamate--tRNA ligase [bacterium]|nr:glutamate--tRNA ligase [bacterium]